MANKKKYCKGCGVLLQNENILKEGYVTSLDNDVCQRCFRIANYGEYQKVTRSNNEFIEILKTVGNTKDLVLHIVDLVNLDKDLKEIRNYISNKMILVLNKKDTLPKSVKDSKILDYIKSLELDYIDTIIISANKNYNLDLLFTKIIKNKTSNKVYIVGKTNTGKSSLINRIIRDYSDNTSNLTISPLPSTTLDMVSIEVSKDLTLIDTPGLIDTGNISNYLENNNIKKLIIKNRIKPKTYQIKKNQSLLVSDLLRIDYVQGEKNSFTLYIPNSIKVKKVSIKNERLKDLSKQEFDLKYREDLVINGLGWVKVVDKGKLAVYIDKNIECFTRRNFI